MKFFELNLADAFVIAPEPFTDERGSFSRIFCQDELRQIGHTEPIAQINHSRNIEKGTVRGLHFQYPPKAEIKIVKCIHGTVFDVIVDIRKNSPTFLGWHAETLSTENMKMMYIPKGFAHGFQTLEPDSELIYFSSCPYSPEFESALRYDDPVIGIQWPVSVSTVSERDRSHPGIDKSFSGIDVNKIYSHPLK